MNLARAMGARAPKSVNHRLVRTTLDRQYHLLILMARLPGIPLDVLDENSVDNDVVKDDMRRILTDMRRFNSTMALCAV